MDDKKPESVEDREPEFHAYQKRVLRGSLILGIAAIPIGVALKRLDVSALALLAVIACSIKLARFKY